MRLLRVVSSCEYLPLFTGGLHQDLCPAILRDIAVLRPTLQELEIGFVPFSPPGKGFLTGAIDLTGEELSQSEAILGSIQVHGHRYPAHLAARVGR